MHVLARTHTQSTCAHVHTHISSHFREIFGSSCVTSITVQDWRCKWHWILSLWTCNIFLQFLVVIILSDVYKSLNLSLWRNSKMPNNFIFQFKHNIIYNEKSQPDKRVGRVYIKHLPNSRVRIKQIPNTTLRSCHLHFNQTWAGPTKLPQTIQTPIWQSAVFLNTDFITASVLTQTSINHESLRICALR